MDTSKILIISNMFPERNPNSLQAGVFVKEQAKALETIGLDVHYHFIDGYKSKWQYLKSIWEINRLLLGGTFDIVHIHYGISGLFLLLNFFTPKNKFFLTLHGSDISKSSKKFVQKTLSKILLQKVGTVIAVNEQMQKDLSSLHSNIHVLPCGIDTDFFSGHRKNDFKPKIIFPSSKKRPEKNFPLFLKAFKLIQSDFPDAQYICFDQLDRESIKNELLNADILILTSLYEGSPQVVKEALSCNLPVVSLPVGDTKQLLNNIHGCYVCKSTDPEEIANAAIEIIKNRIRVTNGKERLHALTLDNHSISKKLYELYTRK